MGSSREAEAVHPPRASAEIKREMLGGTGVVTVPAGSGYLLRHLTLNIAFR